MGKKSPKKILIIQLLMTSCGWFLINFFPVHLWYLISTLCLIVLEIKIPKNLIIISFMCEHPAYCYIHFLPSHWMWKDLQHWDLSPGSCPSSNLNLKYHCCCCLSLCQILVSCALHCALIYRRWQKSELDLSL